MNRITCWLTLSIVLILPLSLSAQKGWKVNAFVMPQVSAMINADDNAREVQDYKMLAVPGIAFGIGGGYHFADMFGVRVGLNYSQQGGRFSRSSGFPEETTFTTRLGYVKIPIMLAFNTSPDSKVMFALSAGYQFGFLANGREYHDSQILLPQIPENVSNWPTTQQKYKRNDNSVVVETGIDVNLGEGFVLNIHVKGDYSLGDIEDKDVTFRLTTNGQTTEVKYWSIFQGSNRTAATKNLVAGLLVGLTYTFPSDQ